MLKQFIRFWARRNKKVMPLYIKLCRPSGPEFAEMVKHHGLFYSMGENCSIIADSYIGDAKYISIGNNVRLASCVLLAHDGVINMLMQAYPIVLDAVGKIVIGDNVFIGRGATVLRGVTIGNNCVVAAGALVVNDIPSNAVVGGVPAKVIGSTDALVERLAKETEALPWYEIIQARGGQYDPALESALYQARIEHFFGPSS